MVEVKIILVIVCLLIVEDHFFDDVIGDFGGGCVFRICVFEDVYYCVVDFCVLVVCVFGVVVFVFLCDVDKVVSVDGVIGSVEDVVFEELLIVVIFFELVV